MAAAPIPEPNGLSQLPTSRVGGIYFLWRRQQVVYVGQSIDITGRVFQHIQENVKAFDGMSFIKCPKRDLNRRERLFIECLLPVYNFCSFSQRVRRESGWRAQPHLRPKATNETIAIELGLSLNQLAWLLTQHGAPRRTRVPRRNVRRWVWSVIDRWADRNAEMIQAAQAMSFD